MGALNKNSIFKFINLDCLNELNKNFNHFNFEIKILYLCEVVRIKR